MDSLMRWFQFRLSTVLILTTSGVSAGRFGHPFDRRLAQPLSAQLLQHDLGRLSKAVLHTRDTGHFASGWRETRGT
jgi:hypothetical protein